MQCRICAKAARRTSVSDMDVERATVIISLICSLSCIPAVPQRNSVPAALPETEAGIKKAYIIFLSRKQKGVL